MAKLGNRSMHNLSSAGKFTVGSAGKSAVGLFKWATSDHLGTENLVWRAWHGMRGAGGEALVDDGYNLIFRGHFLDTRPQITTIFDHSLQQHDSI